jgi:hypothetical protein
MSKDCTGVIHPYETKHVPYLLSAICNNKRNEIAYLKNQIQALEGYVNGSNNHTQQKIENETHV